MAAIGAFAGPAAGADGVGASFVGEVQARGIDQLRRVADFAAQNDGHGARAAEVGAAAAADGAGDIEVARIIRRAGELDQNFARMREGAVDIPERAWAAELREGKARGAAAFEDISRDIGIPGRSGRCMVESRWQICSKLAPKARCRRWMS